MPEIPETNSQLEATGAAQTELRDAHGRRNLLSPDDLAMPTALSQAGPEVAIPLADLTALGSGFSSVAVQAQAIAAQAAATGSGTVLLAVTDSAGNALAPSVLNAAKDGSGLLGSYIGADGLAQARFHEVSTSALTSGTGVVFNPSMILMAFSVMAISRKLDKLQTSINELQRYLEIKDMAELRGALSTLMSDTKKYPLLCKDELYEQRLNTSADRTRHVAEARIYQLQALITDEKNSVAGFRRRSKAKDAAQNIAPLLQEYLLALQSYNFTSLIIVVVQGTYEEAYLNSVREGLREHDLTYRELYTSCYNKIGMALKSSADAKLHDTAANAAESLGKIVSDPVSEELVNAGQGIARSNRKKNRDILKLLRAAKKTQVTDYLQSIDQLQAVNTNAIAYLTDGEALYLVPVQVENAEPRPDVKPEDPQPQSDGPSSGFAQVVARLFGR